MDKDDNALDPHSTTMRAIAAAAGVSVSTVSRALSGRGNLSASTRERVLHAAEQLDWRPVRRGRHPGSDNRLIELVLGGFNDAWAEEATAGAREAAFERGYDLVLTLERYDPEDDWPARVARRFPTGVILGLIRPTSVQLSTLRGLQIPLVLFDPASDPQGEFASVGTTDHQGGYDAGTHLVQAGYQRFIVVGGSPPFRFGRAREAGFRAAITELAPRAVVERIEATWTQANVLSAFRRLVEDSTTPVGVFACNDEMAFAVYRAARRLGLDIPRDVGVVGFNDEPRAITATPALSSVRQPVRQMAAAAVTLVTRMRESRNSEPQHVELPTRLIARASSQRMH